MNQKNNEILKLFHDKVAALRSNKNFYKKVSFQLNFQEGEEVRVRITGPDNQVVKAFILDFRHFVVQKSPVNFYKICSLIYQDYQDKIIKEKIKEVREVWSKILEKKGNNPLGGMRLKVGDKILSSESILNLWFNAEFFHLDEDRRKFLQQLKKTPMGQLTFFVFVDLLQRMGNLLFWFDEKVIAKILADVV